MNNNHHHFIAILLAIAVTVVILALVLRFALLPEKSNSLNSQPFFYNGSSDKAIVLFHGFSASPAEIMPLARIFVKKNYTVIAPVVKGHGTTPEEMEMVTWMDWRDQALETYDAAKKDHNKVFVGGVSMGADLALLVASQRQVAGIITIGAPMALRNKASYFLGILKPVLPFAPHPVSDTENEIYYSYIPGSAVGELILLIGEVRANLPKITEPLVMLQSQTDPTVEPESAQYIFDHVRSIQRQLIWYNTSSHIVLDDPNSQSYVLEDVSKFISIV